MHTAVGPYTTDSTVLAERTAKSRTLLSQVEVEARVEALKQEGWVILPCDDPEQGLRGYLAYRYIAEDTKEPVQEDPGRNTWVRKDGSHFLDVATKPNPDTVTLHRVQVLEEVQNLEWPIFGKPLTPDVRVVEPGELATLLEQDNTYKMCADPKALLLGFVWYKVDEGKAVVRRVRISRLREESAYRGVIQAAWEKVRPRREV